MKSKTPRLLASICLLIVIVNSAQAQEPILSMDLLEESSTILFLGDSITYNGGYIAEFDWWQLTNENIKNHPTVFNLGLPSETVSGLSEDGHAGGRFPRPDLNERLDRTLEAIEPDLVIACYGINCGIYQPFDDKRFQAYKDGIQNLVDKVEFAGARLILVTPPTYDDRRSKLAFSYDDVMRRYSEWLVSNGAENEWQVIDLHTKMKEELIKARGFHDDFTFQPDAVHPNQSGHAFIAQTLIRCFEQDYIHSHKPSDRIARDNSQELLHLWRDVHLTGIGHTRPGLEKGLSLEEAKLKTERLEKQHQASLSVLKAMQEKR